MNSRIFTNNIFITLLITNLTKSKKSDLPLIPALLSDLPCGYHCFFSHRLGSPLSLIRHSDKLPKQALLKDALDEVAGGLVEI